MLNIAYRIYTVKAMHGQSHREAFRYPILFGLCFVLFLSATRFNLEGYELENFLSARNLFQTGSLSLSPGFSGLPGVPDTDGDDPVYPRQNALQAFLLVPFYAAGAWIAGESPMDPRKGGIWLLPAGPLISTSLFNPLVSAGIVILVALLSLEFGSSSSRSLRLAVLTATATMIWPYAGIGMEPLQTFLIILTIWTAVRYRRTGNLKTLAFSVFLLILLPACKKISFVFAVPAAVYLAVSRFERNNSPRRKYLIPAAVILAACTVTASSWFLRSYFQPGFAAHLKYLFGEGGFPAPDILFGLTLSPGEGLFVFNPLLVFAVSAWSGFYREHRREAWLFFGMIAVLLAAVWRSPYLLMDEVWGPRYLHAVLPLLIVAGGSGLTGSRTGLRRVVFRIVLVVSILIQVLGVLTPGYNTLDAAICLGTEDLNAAVFTPSLSQIPLSGIFLASALNRYVTGKSLYLEHTAFRTYSGQGLNRTRQIKYLEGFDHPSGGLFTARWMLAQNGIHMGSEPVVFLIWLVLTAGVIRMLFWFSADKHSG